MSSPPSGYKMAEGLRDELLAFPQEDWMARLREDPRFLNPELLELLVEACPTALTAEPYRAFLLSQLAVELGRLLAEQSADPEVVEVLSRALCLGGHACRLLGDRSGAEELLENGGFLAGGLAARGFFCRALSLLRWDQGRIEEAVALLHQAGRRYEELGDTGEEAACLALLGLLYTEENQFDLAERLLRKARRGLIGKLRPWLTAQTHLALALCLTRTDRPVEARRLRQSAWALSSGVQDEQAQYSLLWREAQVAEALGDLTTAGQLFDSVRRKLIEQGRLRPGSLPSGATHLSDFNSADLVEAYGDSLSRLMRDQFPAVHDVSNPAHEMKLPTLGRRPFTIQRHLINAGLKLISRGENPIVTAEVGTGKSTVALAILGSLAPEHFSQTTSELRRLGFETSRMRPVRRTLIVCPPHLLKSWRDQAAAVLPTYRVQIVKELDDLDRPAEIYVLSRETAKLSHGVAGLGSPENREGWVRQCPRCGRLVTTDPAKLAAKRERCGHKRRCSTNQAARLAEDLAVVLFSSYPLHPQVRTLLANRNILQRLLPEPPEGEEGAEPTAGPPPAPGKIESIARSALRLLCDKDAGYSHPSSGIRRAFVLLAQRAGSGACLPDEVRRLSTIYREDSDKAAIAGHSPFSKEVGDPRSLADELLQLAGLLEIPAPQDRTPTPFLAALEAICSCGTWEETAPCPEPLFQAVPKPRRFPIARYLMRHRRRLACNPDLLILDEAQDYSTPGSAQQKAAHRLVEIPGIPTLALSGSLMGGYAGSLFANFWALSRRFRKAFGRTDKQGFITRYGYRKIYVPAGKEEKTEIAGYGTQSDREDHRATPQARQKSEEAPGILPLFLLEHLLPVSLIMHKEDLEGELPPCREIPIPIEVAEDDANGKELLSEQARLLSTVGHQIRTDMFGALAGKLWGAMSTVPTYLDRSTDDLPPFLLKYPDTVGGAIVAEGKLFPSDWLTPKERWVMARVKTWIEEGRNVLIFLLNTGKSGLPQRYLRLFKEQLDERAIFLDVNKVKAANREEWLDKHVIAPGRRILITNPKAVQTGLNNLVAFSRAIWVQGVDYDARVVRQANGRVHRIGQTLDVTIEVPYYPATVQKTALDLVARKISASELVDGLSIEGALESAGAAENEDESSQAALGIGQAIYEAWRAA